MDNHVADMAGLRVHYLEGGSGPPLVVLHGGTMSSRRGVTRGVFEPLVRNYRVIAPDARGHGGTVNPDGAMTYALLAQDAIALCRFLDLERPMVWGFSDGGNVALEIGMRAPDLPRALVVHAAVTTFSESYYAEMEAFLHTGPGRPPDVDAIIRDGLMVDTWRDLHAAQGSEHWRTLLRDVYPMWTTPLNYTDQDFARVTAPTLVVIGDRDEMTGVEEQVQLFRQLPNAELAVLPGLTHAPPRAADIDVILDFLSRSASN